jgi:[acyl-carrier-protein] S-malonyltransferase
MSLAILCSGQGRQHADMFALTGAAPEAAEIFAAATRVLDGRDPRDIVRQADAAALHANGLGQVLCCTQALAAHVVLRAAFAGEVIYAGYSVGELAAWGCAGLLSPEATLALALQRATIMDESGGPDGALAFVRGLPRAPLDGLCARFGLAIAIVNPGDSFVVGGEASQLDGFCAAAKQAGAGRTGRLDVHVASHTKRLAAATPRFRAALAAAQPAPRVRAGARLLSGIDGESVFSSDAGGDKLAAQISQPVQWAACLGACIEAGVGVMLELGPGRALAEMAARSIPGLEARSLDEFRSLEGIRAWLARQDAGA